MTSTTTTARKTWLTTRSRMHPKRGTGLGRLILIELKLVLREPVVVTFVFAFPVLTVLVLGGVFDVGDPAFEGVNPAHYYAAGYIGVVIAAIGLIMLPVHLAGYRDRGVLRRFRVSRFPRWALPVAHLFVGLVMTAIGVAVLLTVAALTYGLTSVQDVLQTILSSILGTTAFVSIGVLLGSVAPNPRSAQGLGLLLFFPSFLLGGTGPPPDAMSGAMKTASGWMPLTHVVRSIQEPWLNIGSPGDHQLVVAGLLVVSTLAWIGLAVRAED